MAQLQSGAVVRPLVATTTPAPLKANPSASTSAQAQQTARILHPMPSCQLADDIQVLRTKVSLVDIVSKQRLGVCVKSSRCRHYDAFDFCSFCTVNKVPESYFNKRKLEDYESRYEIQELGPKTFRVNLKKLFMNHHSTTQLQLTRKRKNAKEFRCPVCNVKFCAAELMHDDFIGVILQHVPSDYVVIDDDWNCEIVEDKEHDQDDVVVLSDDDNNGDTGRAKKRRKIQLFSDEEFSETEESEDEMLGGTEDDPLVIDD